jgi:hypothetical protein
MQASEYHVLNGLALMASPSGCCGVDTVPPYRIQAVNRATLEDSHSVISGRASRAVRPPAFGDRHVLV